MGKILIKCDANNRRRREYIYDVVFRDFWDIEYDVIYEHRSNLLIIIGDKQFQIDDTFFQKDELSWLKKESLPCLPLKRSKVPYPYNQAVTDDNLPVIYGTVEKNIIFEDMRCNIDVFGSAFFMLTRYEEHADNEGNNRDLFGRFPASASTAYKEKFLERPIINEYLELLWMWMKRTCPTLVRRQKRYSIMPTHDCDVPFWSLSQPWWIPYRSLAGDFLKMRDCLLGIKKIEYLFRRTYDTDPYNVFSKIMDVSEKRDLVSTFFFMTSIKRHRFDGNYDILSAFIKRLFHEILQRGHKIGIHPGLGSCYNEDWFRTDVCALRGAIKAHGIDDFSFGGRQHFLQWESANTWKLYARNGLVYDSTLGFADHIGFRCGVCYDYPVYNVLDDEKYNLREYPLAVMEQSGLDKSYMELSDVEMINRCNQLKMKVKKYSGIFIILWHNTSLLTKERFEMYKNILDG